MTVETTRLPDAPQGAEAVALPTGTGLRAGLSLVPAGSMALSRRGTDPWHARFLRAHDVPADTACSVHQVHSQRVLVVDAATAIAALPLNDADGMITDRDGVFLTVTVADCLPIILEDTAGPAFGLVHSGWRGTGIVLEALRLMASRYGTRASNVRATIGPGIGACCYAVPEERARLFASAYGPGSVVREHGVKDGAPRLDLRAANLVLLGRVGVASVTVVSDCTSCTAALGSFRRQGPEAFTLMLAYVGRGRA